MILRGVSPATFGSERSAAAGFSPIQPSATHNTERMAKRLAECISETMPKPCQADGWFRSYFKSGHRRLRLWHLRDRAVAQFMHPGFNRVDE